MKDERIKTYLSPVKIVAKSENVTNEQCLIGTDATQVCLFDNNFLYCKGKGYIILDFGKEICGGLRILNQGGGGQSDNSYLRIRFGESLSESCAEIGEKNATNNHSPRDLTTLIPDFSDIEVGSTGFRFVRIDFISDLNYVVKAFYAVLQMRDLEYVGDFTCDDERINEIYKTARYTLHLNIQNYIWDGIKRDRLVWVGDMEPEIRAITDVFGENKAVEDTLDFVDKAYPLPCWIVAMPTYSVWYMQIVYDYYMKTGKKEFLQTHLYGTTSSWLTF